MGLLHNNAAPGEAPPPDEIMQLAARVRDSLREDGNRGAGTQLKTFATEIRRCLSIECGGDAARLSRVWLWYCDNVKNKALNLPDKFSANGMRKWFVTIEDRMVKGEKGKKLEVVSEDAAGAAKSASQLGFPPLFRPMAETYAQKCIDAISPLRIKLSRWVDERNADFEARTGPISSAETSPVRCAEFLLANWGSNRTFATRYLEWVARRLAGDWFTAVDYSYFLFDPNGVYFADLCCNKILYHYCGAESAGKRWHKLKEVMGL